jgi:small-conductance mechanosensitive channel
MLRPLLFWRMKLERNKRMQVSPTKRVVVCLASLVSVLCFTAAATQNPPNSSRPAPVVLGDKQVFEIRWGYKSITAQMRASAISERLRKLAKAPEEPPRFMVTQSDLSADIMAGDEHVASAFEGDAAIAGKSRDQVAQEWAAAMESALKDYRAQHSWERKLLRAGLALLALAVCVVLVIYERRLVALLASGLYSRLTRQTEERVALGHHVSRALVQTVRPAARLLRFVLAVGILYGTFQVLLYLFPATRHLAFPLWNSSSATVRAFLDSAWKRLPALFFVALLVFVTYYILKVSRFFFKQVREGTITLEGFHPRWASTTHRLVSIAIVTLAVLVAYPYIPGSDSAAFKGVSIFLGVLVSLGSTGLISNLIAGIMLTYMEHFDTGDLVKIGGNIGFVRKTSLLTTTIETRKSERVTIPNSAVIAADVTNFTKAGGKGLIISVTAGIGYDTPWRQVEAMMKEAALRSEGIRREPEPFVLELSLNSFDITYELDAFLEPGALFFTTKANLCRNILDQFNEHGVQIMTPAYEFDPLNPKVVPREQWYTAPAREGAAPEKKASESRAA